MFWFDLSSQRAKVQPRACVFPLEEASRSGRRHKVRKVAAFNWVLVSFLELVVVVLALCAHTKRTVFGGVGEAHRTCWHVDFLDEDVAPAESLCCSPEMFSSARKGEQTQGICYWNETPNLRAIWDKAVSRVKIAG